jgi:hypothetical protein
MSKTKKTLIAIVIVFGLVQFIPDSRPEVKMDATLAFEPKDVEVQSILKKACMDCHSNETTYPWYASIAPVNYWIDGHIEDGREVLNFSEWKSYPVEDQKHLAKEAAEIVENKEMPMLFYWLIHWDAKLTDEERTTLIEHFNSI